MAYNLRRRTIAESLRDVDEREEVIDAASDSEEDHVSVQSESDSDYQESSDEDLENASLQERLLQSRARGRPTAKLRGKNGFVWDTRPPSLRLSDRINNGDDANPVPGPCGPAASLTTFSEFWEALFTPNIIRIIVEHTNTEIERQSLEIIEKGGDLQTYHHHCDEEEIRALIAALYYGAAWKNSNCSTKDLWNHHNGVGFYRALFSRNRFAFLMACIRFDDKATRNRENRFAPFQEVWDIFIGNCTACYRPGRKCTLDEILLGFRGSCKFRMYIKSKPDRYGLKFFALNDASTSYLINAVPYLGKIEINDKLPNEQLSEYYFRITTAPIHGTDRTVTCDNWFTSIPLILRMKEEPYRMTITGTIRKNKREIPAEMLVASKEVPNAKFCFAQGMELVSFTPKKNKIALVVSNHISSIDFDGPKPVVVKHYDKTKGGTDCFDWLVHSHTTTKRTNRWPLRDAFGMLDFSAVNARILLKCRNEALRIDRNPTAKECLDELVIHLATPMLQNRYANLHIRSSVKAGIGLILCDEAEARMVSEDDRPRFEIQKRCSLCPRSQDRKTSMKCPSCLRPMCDKHRVYICNDCTGMN